MLASIYAGVTKNSQALIGLSPSSHHSFGLYVLHYMQFSHLWIKLINLFALVPRVPGVKLSFTPSH